MRQIILATILFAFLIVSCKSNKGAVKIVSFQKKSVSISPGENAWLDTLNQEKEAMRNTWLNQNTSIRLFSGLYKSDNYYGLSSPSELNECDILPQISYILDSDWIDKITKNPSIPIGDLLSVSKERAAFWAVKNERFYYSVQLEYTNKNWKFASYGPPYRLLSDSLAVLYFQKKVNVHEVIEATTNRLNLIYFDKGIVMDLDAFGKSQPLRDELMLRINRQKNGNHF